MPDSEPSSPAGNGGAEAITRTFYAELRSIAERMLLSERAGHTLQPTAVVNEACVRLLKHGLPPVSREQRLAIAARVLRQVLVDHGRARGALKRGGDPIKVGLEDAFVSEEPTVVDFERLHTALERLRRLHERQADVLLLRIFGGLTMDQIATVLELSKRTVEGDWAVARAWMRRELSPPALEDEP